MTPRTPTRSRMDRATPKATAAPRGAYLQSLQRGLAVLNALAGSPRVRSARELAEATALDRTITHRILRTLELEGLVETVPGGYRLGAHALLLGNAYLEHMNIRRLALPYMLNLLHRGLKGHEWPMAICVPVAATVTIIDQLWPPNGALDVVTVGMRFAIDRTAAGRCILAYRETADVEALLGSRRTKELAPRFAEIRAAGGIDFAREDEPHGRPGLAALSALIRDRGGRPVAGLSISGLGLEPFLRRDSEVALKLQRAAHQIGMLI